MSKLDAHRHEYAGRTAVVVGAGGSGRAAARLLHALGASVRVLERDLSRLDPEFVEFSKSNNVDLVGGEHDRSHFKGVDLVVMSPGVPASKIYPLLQAGRPGLAPMDQEPAAELIGEMELASRFLTEPMIAVTGTNGKTTTVTLAAHMLESVGRRVFLGGNVGTPLSEYVLSGKRADCVVLEASSFQLQTCATFHPWVSVLLNFSPDHLDYHADMDEYLEAKMRLFIHQEEHELAILPAAQRAMLEPHLKTRARVVWYRAQQRFHSRSLIGEHNQANMEAAYQACRFLGITECEAQMALGGMCAMADRQEPVAEVRGVLFVNDTKATTVEALGAALAAADRPVNLLAGGTWKGGELDQLADLVRGKVRRVGLYGASREIFERAFTGLVEVSWDETLELATRRLFDRAQEGECILLSPATSSFDQYSDYKARGGDFKRIAAAIGEENREGEL